MGRRPVDPSREKCECPPSGHGPGGRQRSRAATRWVFFGGGKSYNGARTFSLRSFQRESRVSSFGSVTRWLNQLQGGDRAAVQKLWEGYFARLVGLARKRLRDFPRQAADEEDVALSAFDSFCRGAEQGRFPRLEDRDDLWQVLVLITARKACDLQEHEGRRKRDWRRTRPAGRSQTADESFFPELIGREPDPAFAAQVADEYQRLLDGLRDDG